ncbi:MAG: sugar phosphate isomerase/epimerase [Thermomicrobiales bacterium]|nr:sugar phosphate isomerase/epimerase [Thermomicrobiales bacterium]
MNNNLAISTYSYHRFGSGPEGADLPTMETMIKRTAAYGIQGLEIIGNHLDQLGQADTASLHQLKQLMAAHGVAPVSVSAHHNFVQPDPAVRNEHIARLKQWIDAAYEIGAPFVRAFGGRWGTMTNFGEFMAAGGNEPPIDGYTLDDAFQWTIDSFIECAAYASGKGVTILLENHWGLTGTAAGTLRIFEGVNSPWLKLVLDTGNFIQEPDQYAEMALMLPHCALIHAKTYIGKSLYFDEFDLDYARIARLLKDAGYQGYLSIEFEGKAHPDEGIPASIAQVRAGLAAVD